jgi:hypothetical protein
MISMKPTMFDSQLLSHSMEIGDRVWSADQVSLAGCEEFHGLFIPRFLNFFNFFVSIT